MTPDEVFQLNYAYDRPADPFPGFVSTGSVGLDLALGTGGWPLKQVSVIYGEASAGKSTLAYATIAEMQKSGTVALVDLSRDFDPVRARALGFDDLLLFSGRIPFPHGWPAGVPYVVVDNISWGDEADRLMSFQEITGTTVVATSQIRSQLSGTPGHPPWTSGYLEDASVRVRLSKGVSAEVTAEVVRNVYRPVKSSAKFNIGYAGIDRPREILVLALQAGLIRSHGSWLYLGEHPLGQGLENAQRGLQELTGALDALESQLRARSTLLGYAT
jgi:recombination protein RecA